MRSYQLEELLFLEGMLGERTWTKLDEEEIRKGERRGEKQKFIWAFSISR